MDDKKPSNYVVGYRKPPKQSRFKPGESGNPRGRSKGTLNLKTDLAEELSERIRVREGDRERAISKQRALIKALTAKALKGDTRAAALLIALIAKHIEPDLAQHMDEDLSPRDREIIADFLRRNGPAASE